jgi:hypothetical protein
MGCVSWLIIDLNPHLFLTDVLSGLSVCGACSAIAFQRDSPCSYGEKLVALDDASGRCSELYRSTVDLVANLAALVKQVSLPCSSCLQGIVPPARASLFSLIVRAQNHSHGLIWNPRGEDFVAEPLGRTAAEDAAAELCM